MLSPVFEFIVICCTRLFSFGFPAFNASNMADSRPIDPKGILSHKTIQALTKELAVHGTIRPNSRAMRLVIADIMKAKNNGPDSAKYDLVLKAQGVALVPTYGDVSGFLKTVLKVDESKIGDQTWCVEDLTYLVQITDAVWKTVIAAVLEKALLEKAVKKN